MKWAAMEIGDPASNLSRHFQFESDFQHKIKTRFEPSLQSNTEHENQPSWKSAKPVIIIWSQYPELAAADYTFRYFHVCCSFFLSRTNSFRDFCNSRRVSQVKSWEIWSRKTDTTAVDKKQIQNKIQQQHSEKKIILYYRSIQLNNENRFVLGTGNCIAHHWRPLLQPAQVIVNIKNVCEDEG